MDTCYFYMYKPYQTLSQFTSPINSHRTLKHEFDFPPGVYPVGRLDRDSEGLLILTNDPTINTRLLHPRHQHKRTYYVQVEGVPEANDLSRMTSGIHIRLKKMDYTTLPCEVEMTNDIDWIPPRDPPIRFRKHVPTSWLIIVLKEGKNRQVRKMCAAIGFPVLRLIRSKIEDLTIRDFKVGEVRDINYSLLMKKLRLS